MSPGDGLKPDDTADKGLGEIVAEVSEKASQLVREEVELAKAEVQQKISKLARGAAVAAAAGIFLVFMFAFLLETLAWLLVDALDSSIWVGFAITAGILLLLAGIAGFLAARWLRSGAPPTPELAIEEAKRTREQLEWQKVERDQVGRTLEKGERF
jgi:uncharacterized membrane protein YqjE